MVWLVAVLGVAMGAFINLCADSLPGEHRIRRVACPSCGAPRPGIAWSGLIAFLSQRSRCASCGSLLPVRHVVVELGTALIFAFAWQRTGATLTTVLNMLYSSVFMLVLVTDLEHRLIQHVIMLPALLLAFVGAFVNPAFRSPKLPLLGGAIGLLGTYAVYLFGALFARWMGKLRGQQISEAAFGFGDVTLNTFIGLVVGAPHIIFAMVIGFLLGGLVAIVYLMVQGLVRRQYRLFTAIPYGPFLIAGGLLMLYFGRGFMDWYMYR